MTSNQVTGMAEDAYRGWGKERRFLMLHYSRDAQNWFPAGVLAMWPRETQAFNYCTPVIDGDDLLFVSRTAQNARNQHDNDCVTFHRMVDFRKTQSICYPIGEERNHDQMPREIAAIGSNFPSVTESAGWIHGQRPIRRCRTTVGMECSMKPSGALRRWNQACRER